MPRGFENNESSGGGGEFLKLGEGDIAKVILTEEPFQCGEHRLEVDKESNPYGKQILCSKADLGSCAICDRPEKYLAGELQKKSTGFYSLFVGTVQRKNGTKDEINAMRIMQGGWSLISPFKSAYDAQQFTQESMVGIPFLLSREGSGNKTRYNIAMKPNMEIKAEGDPINVEEFAINKMRSEWRELNFSIGDEDDEDEAAENDPFEEAKAA